MKLISKRLAVIVALVAVVAVGCDGGSTDTTSVSTTTSPQQLDVTPEEQDDFTDALESAGSDIEDADALATAESVCVNLRLLQAAGTPPGHAADAIEFVLLEDATTAEKAEYGLILSLAPQKLCDEVLRYGEQVSYWLGF